ncbi:MAG: hypothetical protein EOP85_09570 [Verrucomicrobiaceae bacterium]|nr:MAG: hypothetical protein EOP85_09570 [Verrucomicrobiaceae bacterium]
MNLFTESAELSTTVSSPKLDLIQTTWDHIAERYLKRISSNRILTGRVRAIRLLAVHDAVHSVIDPGNGHIYKDISEGSTIEAAYAAAVQASHDVLASVFTDADDREDLADHLEESLSLIGKEDEKEAGAFSGADSATAYIRSFAPLIVNRGHVRQNTFRRELAGAA